MIKYWSANAVVVNHNELYQCLYIPLAVTSTMLSMSGELMMTLAR